MYYGLVINMGKYLLLALSSAENRNYLKDFGGWGLFYKLKGGHILMLPSPCFAVGKVLFW